MRADWKSARRHWSVESRCLRLNFADNTSSTLPIFTRLGLSMRLVKGLSCLVLASALTGGGCAVPQYDVPYTEIGRPTVKTIIERIQCEIRDLVRTDITDPTDPSNKYGGFLRSWDTDVLIAMSIEVNNTGGLTPSLSYMNPLSAATSFTFAANLTLSESRDHTFTENLQYSVRQIYIDWYSYKLAERAGLDTKKLGLTAHDCPEADTNLSGTLGIVDFVAMAGTSEGLDTTTTAANKIFGGSIQFLVTKNINATGPTWSLVHFKGPGGLGALSQVNTDKITLSFAQGPDVGHRMLLPTLAQVVNGLPTQRPHAFNINAWLLLQQQLTGSIGSQLSTLQNGLVVTNGPH
jgi:hypothetical protein